MAANPHILQVSELTKKVRFILESELNTVWLCGEISNFINASSGHWYLSLKDSKSQVRCAMFKGNNRRVAIKPSNGQQVLVRAKVSLYEPRGDFQLIIEHMENAGEGLLRQQFEQLKAKLNNEGLFNLANKKSLPEQITTLGIVTSPTGAAVKDIIAVLQRRNPLINIIIYPALVQGELAANDIVQAIQLANARQECEVLIVGRGGGSLEDLWPFNEEIVVRSVFNSEIPTISAVGHEIDTTLCDYVADLRAPTPSAAAEVVASDVEQISYRINHLTEKLQRSLLSRIENHYVKHSALVSRLSNLHPEQQIQVQQQKADELHIRLLHAMNKIVDGKKLKPTLLSQRLSASSPITAIKQHQASLLRHQTSLHTITKQKLHTCEQAFASIIEQLHIVSPLATIARGYSITRDDKQNVVKSTNDINVGDNIAVQLTDGVIQANVTSK